MPGAYLAANLISASATITPSSEDSAYPKENIYDKQAANVFRCYSQTSLDIEIDFGADIQADTISLINHNLTAGATLDLKAGASPAPSSSVIAPANRANDLWSPFAPASHRFWLLTIADTNPAALQIGQMIIGTRVALPRARRIGDYSPAIKRATISGETYAGVFWNYPLFKRHQLNPSFRVGSAAEFAILAALDEAVHGNLYPFLYIPDGNGADCFYVRKELDFEPQEYQGRLAGRELVHDYQMTLIEESRGLEILP
jgi:hypothetical protein